jgi:hypothetical protein
MKSTVVQLHSVAYATLILVDDKFIVEAEFALRRTRKVCTHLDMAVDIRAKDIT